MCQFSGSGTNLYQFSGSGTNLCKDLCQFSGSGTNVCQSSGSGRGRGDGPGPAEPHTRQVPHAELVHDSVNDMGVPRRSRRVPCRALQCFATPRLRCPALLGPCRPENRTSKVFQVIVLGEMRNTVCSNP